MSQLEELIVKIQADTSGLRGDLGKLEKSVGKSSKDIEGSIGSLATKSDKHFSLFKQAAATSLGFIGSQVIIAGFRKATEALSKLFDVLVVDGISAAQNQEDAINKLNISLAQNGEFSQETSKRLQDFASELQSVTRFGDEAILSQLSFAQSMGASAEQSEMILKASTDMSEALGIDLNSAVRNISKTLGGYAGELGEVIPELKNLTQEQLQNGEGIDLLAKKYKGFAALGAKSFSGSLQQIKNSFGDLTEQIGSVFTENDAVLAGMDEIQKIMGEISQVFDGNKETIKEFVTQGILLLIDSLPMVVDLISGAAKGFSFLSSVLDDAGIAIARFTFQSDDVIEQLVLMREESKKAQVAQNEFFDSVKGKAQEYADRIRAAAESSSVSIGRQTDALAKLNAESKALNDARANQVDIFYQNQIDAAENAAKEQVRLLKASFDEQQVTEEEFANRSVEIQENKKQRIQEIEQAKNDELLRMNEEQITALRELRMVELEELSAERADEISAIEEQNAKKLDLINLFFEQEKATLEEQRKEGIISDQEFMRQKELLDRKHKIQLKKNEEDLQKEREELLKRQLQASADIFGNISNLAKVFGKEGFAIAKAAAAAQATVQGVLAVQNALASAPFPLNIVLAATTGALAAANVAKIISAPPPGFQRGIDSVPGVGFSDSFPAMLAPKERVVPAETNKDLTAFLRNQERGERRQSQPTTVVNLTVNGNIFDRRETGLEIIEMINDAKFQTGAAVL